VNTKDIFMLEYEAGLIFNILGTTIALYSEELDVGINTVANIGDDYFYLGNQPPNIETVVRLWEQLNNRSLTQQELDKVMSDNNLKSQAI
jgi:hypothetical protein